MTLPPGYVSEVQDDGTETGPGWGWAAKILPQMEEVPLNKSLVFARSVERVENLRGRTTVVSGYLCPSDSASETWTVGTHDAMGRYGMKQVTWLLFVTTLILVVGCSQAPRAEPIAVESVPEDIMKVANENLPEITFEQALRRADGSYEVRGKDKNGKVRDIDISSTGEVIAIE